MNSFVLRSVMLIWLTLSINGPAWSEVSDHISKVLILPPSIHGPTEMAYLRQGLVDMLSTRLAEPGKVVVVSMGEASSSGGPFTAASASAQAGQAGADFVVFGSLTLLGNGVSTDLRMVDASTEAVVLAFSRSGSDPSSILEHADAFAVEVGQKVFGRSGPERTETQSTASPPEVGKPVADPTHQHPEKLLQQPMTSGEDGHIGEAESGAAMIGAARAVRGPRIDGQVQGIAIGDVDGDGAMETVIAGKSRLWIYKFIDGRFVRMAEEDGSGNYIGLDTADVNGNGKEEIFVSNYIDEGGRLSAFVLEYDGHDFKRIAERLNFYFRAIHVPTRGRVLYSQKHGLDTLFHRGVYEIVWENGEYRQASRLKLPREQNIYGMGLGTIPSSPEQLIFAYDSSTRLQVMDGTGRQEWVSTRGYGAVATFVKTRSQEDLSGYDYHYIGGRIEMVDLDGDGNEEAVVLRNEDITGNITKRTRLFKHGRIEILKSDELGMSPRFQTRFLPKYISDFALADLDRDGNQELVAAVVQKSENIASTGRTNIILFHLDGLTAAGK